MSSTSSGTGDPAAEIARAKRIADGLQFACRLPDRKPDFTFCGGPAAEAYWEYFTPARISRLLDAVTNLADDWDAEAARCDKRAERTAMSASRQGLSVRASAHEDCARELREAIRGALAAQPNDERNEP